MSAIAGVGAMQRGRANEGIASTLPKTGSDGTANVNSDDKSLNMRPGSQPDT